MSLGINTTTPEGIVLAADSRQSYRNRKGVSRIGSDSASKVFRLGNTKGVVVAGPAFLPEGGVAKNISRFVEDFRDTTDCDKLSVKEVSDELKKYFEEKYHYKTQLEALPDMVTKDLTAKGCTNIVVKKEAERVTFTFNDPSGRPQQGVAGVDQLQLLVAGYSPDKSHQVCMVYIPGNVDTKRDSAKKGQEYGASWIGQIDVLGRIVLGFDGRIGNLPMMQKLTSELGAPEVNKQLRMLEYSIQWGTMTLQDGIDFSVLAIETTTAIQRFSDGIAADPGDMPGVGGAVDVAVITPEKGFVWVAKKILQVGDNKLDLEKVQVLK